MSAPDNLKRGSSPLFGLLLIAVLIGIGVVLADNLGFNADIRKKADSSSVVYYVDCNAGVDSNAGTSETTAWKTIDKVNNAILRPGEKVLFKRGCTWTTTNSGNYLTANWAGTSDAPITLGAYGSGNLPIIQSDARGVAGQHINVSVGGSYLVIENLHSTLINHYRENTCKMADGTGVRLGWYLGFSVRGHHNTIQNVEAEKTSIGINLADGNNNNKVLNNHLHDLNSFWRIDRNVGALGAMGVNIWGDDNEIGYNLIERNGTECNYVDTGQLQNYSAPFETFNANRAYVHHNKAFENRKHFEMGKSPDKTSTGNVLAYNLFVSSKPNAKGPNIHGDNNEFGPIDNTQIYNNTIVFTGPGSEGITCGCSGGATIKNNIFVAESKAAYYRGAVTQSNNLYWDYQRTSDTTADPTVQFSGGGLLDSTSLRVDPQFVNITSGDYHLGASSPALNRGISIGSLLTQITNSRLMSVLAHDLDRITTPQGVAVELGAYEFPVATPAPSNSPTPTPTAASTPATTPTVSPTSSGIPSDALPFVTITSPANGSLVERSNVTNINATATDDNGIAKVQFFVDGNLLGEDTTSPYSYGWKVTGTPDKEYILRARATDTIGQVKNASITVHTSH